MTSPSIGGYTFQVFNGRMMRANRMVGTVDPAVGVDGNAVVKAGWRAGSCEIRTIVESSGNATTADTNVQKYYALEGQVVTVVDQFGITWPDTTVLRVVADYSLSFASSIYVVRATWTLLPATNRPAGATP